MVKGNQMDAPLEVNNSKTCPRDICNYNMHFKQAINWDARRSAICLVYMRNSYRIITMRGNNTCATFRPIGSGRMLSAISELHFSLQNEIHKMQL